MFKKIINFSLLFALFSCFEAQAQANESDAIRYALTRTSASARVAAVGGAYGAVGSDLGGLSINPAGLGVYRSNNLVITPGLDLNFSNAEFLGRESSDSKPNFFISNAGYVWSNDISKKYRTEEPAGWQRLNFSITFNRTNNFHARTSAVGETADHSLTHRFAELANGTPEPNLLIDDTGILPDLPFTSALAYNAFLINPDPNTPEDDYLSIVNGLVRQSERSRSTGRMSDLSFAIGGNYANKFYIGGSVSLLRLNYKNVRTFTEEDVLDTIYDFERMSYTEELQTKGYGVNLKLGMIWAVTDWWRLGASVQSPSYFALTEDYESSLSAELNNPFDGPASYDIQSPAVSEFDYNYETPLKVTLSSAFMFGKKGFLSIDYDWVDYSQTTHRTRESSQDFEFWALDLNEVVQNVYQPASNLRIGGEVRNGNMSFRAGAALWGSPFKSDIIHLGGDLAQLDLSAGLGIRNNRNYMDFALINSTVKDYRMPYTLDNGAGNGILNTQNRLSFLVTFGVKI